MFAAALGISTSANAQGAPKHDIWEVNGQDADGPMYVLEKCLQKSDNIGLDGMVPGAMAFDQTEEITSKLMSGYTPYQYYICLTEPERGDKGIPRCYHRVRATA